MMVCVLISDNISAPNLIQAIIDKYALKKEQLQKVALNTNIYFPAIKVTIGPAIAASIAIIAMTIIHLL